MVDEYTVDATKCTPDHDTWTTTANDQTVSVSVPEEYGGTTTGASPEHLYATALLNCYIATFRVIAQKSDLSFSELNGEATVTLDADDEPPVKSATITLEYDGADQDRVKHIAEKAKQHCYVHQSVKTDIAVTIEHS